MNETVQTTALLKSARRLGIVPVKLRRLAGTQILGKASGEKTQLIIIIIIIIKQITKSRPDDPT